MKILTILRHAKTEPHRRGDFDRALIERGIHDAKAMGNYARVAGLHFDHVLASPARRTTQTIELFYQAYGEDMPKPEFEPQIYDASLATLTNIVRNLPNSAYSLLICGHNPAMQGITLMLARNDDGSVSAVREKFPTAALATIRLDIDDWADLARGCGELIDFQTPAKPD